jgi:hypothetical protein
VYSNQRSLANMMMPSGAAVQTMAGVTFAIVRNRVSLWRSASSA